MDVNAMDGTYLDYVKQDETPLGTEPNALADHADQEVPPVREGQEAAAAHEATIRRVKGVIKDLIDAGNTYWAKELLIALDLDSGD